MKQAARRARQIYVYAFYRFEKRIRILILFCSNSAAKTIRLSKKSKTNENNQKHINNTSIIHLLTANWNHYDQITERQYYHDSCTYHKKAMTTRQPLSSVLNHTTGDQRSLTFTTTDNRTRNKIKAAILKRHIKNVSVMLQRTKRKPL